MDADWNNDDEADDRAFREQCRRQMARPLEARMKYGFCRVNRPVLDQPGVRIFSSTRAYREWCAANLPAYIGFQITSSESCRSASAQQSGPSSDG